jgi:hypothetical protein
MCSICCETFTNKKRAKIECPHCEFLVCKVCFETYLLTDNSMYPKCMKCNHELNIDFLHQNTSKIFCNSKFLEKRARDSLSREKSLLPKTQIYVKREKEKRKLILEIKEKQAEYEELQRLTNNAYYEKRVLEGLLHNNYSDITNIDERSLERLKFSIGCPIKDCKGFLSQSYKCGTCGVKVCPHCREPKEYTQEQLQKFNIEQKEHVCDENIVENIKLIKSDSKPCPNCRVSIYKIEGCDQMYCTSCNTPFSWKTGKKVSGRIHNPHYYEFLRNQANGGPIAREPGDNPCEQQVGIPIIRFIIKKYASYGSLVDQNNSIIYLPMFTVMEALRMPLHIREVLLPEFPLIEQMENSKEAIKSRVKYLMNEMQEDAWLSIIKSRLKRADFAKNINELLTMVALAIDATFQNTFDQYRHSNTHSVEEDEQFKKSIYTSIPKFYKELDSIKKYANEEFRKLNRQYNLRTFVITEYWAIKPCNSSIIPRVCSCDYDPNIRPPRVQRVQHIYCKC